MREATLHGVRVATKASLVLGLVALLGAVPLAAAFDVPDHPVDVILGRPTGTSITVSVVAYQNGDGYVEVSPAAGGAATTTAVKPLPAEQGVEFLLDGLAPNTAYAYRLFWRAGTSGGYTATPAHAFRTARPAGSPFTFTIHADSHLDDNTVPALFARTLENALADAPDFHVDLGDTFMTDKYRTFTDARPQYDAQRYYLGLIGASAPVFFTLGNHDGEIGYAADGTASSIAAWSGRLRTNLLPNPVPDSFYTGNPTPEPNVGLLGNYYAFAWGDALFVVLDPFWPTRQKGNGTDNWNWTLGDAQYAWLRSTLESSAAKLKFVFIHHLVGGFGKDRRGGAEAAPFWEWGGANADGSPGFAEHRPGWAEPLHALFVRTGVTAVFHGHDHLYVKQELDGIVYQEVPQPGFPRPDSTGSAAEYGYVSGVILGSSGHLRVRVDGGTATVDYVRALLPGDETPARRNGDVISSYTVTGSAAPPPAITRILGQPTDRSVTVSARADAALEVYFEYGPAPSSYVAETAPAAMAADPHASGFWVSQTVIRGLSADTRYWYRMQYRPAGSSGAFTPGPESAFHTQRPPGSRFVFCAQGDSHPERSKSMFDADLYSQTLRAVAAEEPDFHVLSGDDFSVDTLPIPYTESAVTGRYTLQLPYLDLVGRSSPLFLVNGNHEQASLWNYSLPPDANNTNQIPVWAQGARNLYYPSPAPNDPNTGTFYSGNPTSLPGIGPLRDYYAWQHGDALFVVIDPYWTSPAMVDNGIGPNTSGNKTADRWLVTHGDTQYAWLKRTLEQSTAKWKFVFAHHVMGTGRGCVEIANQWEWGGQNADGSDGFAAHRPAWALPIHQLMAANNVTIFFQGHDHLFARQQLDGVTYQELPNPADFTYTAFNADAYTSGDVLPNSGYVRVTVSPAAVRVDYVREFLPKDESPGQQSGQVAFSYTIGSATPPAPCVPDPQTMCLVGGRYRVTSRWKNQYAGGAEATLSAAPLTDATGAFHSSDPASYEYLIRINTATDNGKAWIAIPTFTDVEFWIAVTDTVSGQYKEYHSPAGNRTLIYDPSFFVYP
jgi:phosphodiesterase/alkaline phosphatase D-like protein